MPDELRMKGPYRYDEENRVVETAETQAIVVLIPSWLINDLAHARGRWIAEALNRYEQEQTNNE